MSEVDRRWRGTWRLVGTSPPESLLRDLVRHYEETHRYYHDLGHVLDCLEKAAASRQHQERPALVDLALWYHDVLYDPRRSDNETRSADLAEAALENLLDPADLAAIRAMILDTRHQQVPASADGALVVDIDLSILGSPPERFRAYDEAIRREYSWVPALLYRRQRARVLRSFLDRPRIFTSPFFHDRYEARARVNISRTLESL